MPADTGLDLNLLPVLDALLQAGSVTGAAERLHLTPSAVSRSLTRLRELTGDPLLVRTGRALSPTPVAEEMRERVRDALAAAQDVLRPDAAPTDADLERTLDTAFAVRMGTDATLVLGPALLAAVRERAPGVRLRMVGEGSESVADLRDGVVDLDVGAPADTGSELIHRETLIVDEMVVIARADGRLAAAAGSGALTAELLADHEHVAATRRGVLHGPLDDRLAEHGLARRVVATAPGHAPALALVRGADLVGLVPRRLTGEDGDDLRTWPSPVPLPPLVVEQAWHRRTHSDPARRWLRARVREAAARVARDGAAAGTGTRMASEPRWPRPSA